ncbi:MAG: hypothetical protein LKJ76_02055 [Lachnospiraceae bacterium]|jgi:hypothetical protein|nr:hypothetical protein [Lachnospiraceae bacterium]
MFLVLAANPSCFVIGGILLFEMLRAAMTADRKRAVRCLAAGAGVAACFAAYYILWLKGGNTSFMQNYWNDMAVRIFPVSRDTWKQDVTLFQSGMEMLAEDRWLPVFCMLTVTGAIVSFFQKNRLGPAIALSLLLACTASALHMFPVTERLWVFSYPLLVLMSFYAAEELPALLQKGLKEIPQKEKTREMTAAVICAATAVIMAFMVFANSGIVYYSDTENVYWDGEETASLIRYVQQHVTGGEKVYVYYHSVFAFDFYEGSTTNRIGSVSEDNVIRSTGSLSNKESRKRDVKSVREVGKCWIITSHVINGRLNNFAKALKKTGTLDVAYVSHGTYLYYYKAAEK